MVKTNHDDMGGGILLFGIQSDYALGPFNYYERTLGWVDSSENGNFS